jgi:DnaA family protein
MMMKNDGPQASQMTLPVALNDEATFDNFFITDASRQLIAAMQGWREVEESFMYLFGMPGCGCSHLLQAACQQAAERGLLGLYLPLKDLVDYPAQAMLDGLEAMDLICIDDIDAIAGNQDWEEALFHLYNRVKASNATLLIAGHQAPAMLNLGLPDLVSRLQWGLSYRIADYSEQDLVGILCQRAKSRGLVLMEEVALFLVSRAKRQPSELIALLEKLDQASLQSGRKLTIPFVKSVLAW